jgi:ADP-dependent NAD(P)H-hydrate dehydratase
MSRSHRAEGLVGSDDARPLTPSLLRGWPLPLEAGDSKRERGTVLVVAGTTRTAGAAMLAGVAALRAGAGRLQIATVEASAAALSVAVPEALIEGLPATAGGSIEPASASARLDARVRRADAVLIGPGFDDPEATSALLSWLLGRVGPDAVVVVDALALRSVGSIDDGAMRELAGRAAFTPNRDEASALVGEGQSDAEPGDLGWRAAKRYGAVVTVQGRIAAPDGRRWAAASDVAGLGTSGSGDVLAGLVAGAAARCGDAAQATCWGTYLHLAAGERLSRERATIGFLARELLEAVPAVLSEVAP